MIRACLILAWGMLMACPALARGVHNDPVPAPFDVGQIEDFYRNPYAQDQEPGWAWIIEQRIWDGDEWLPLASQHGADFLRRYEQEIRDGTVDSE